APERAAVGDGRGEARVVGTQRELVERPARIDVVLEVLRPELAELVLAAELAPFEPEVGGLAHRVRTLPERPRSRQSIRSQVDGTAKSRADTPGETSVASAIVTRPPSTWSSANRRRPSPE